MPVRPDVSELDADELAGGLAPRVARPVEGLVPSLQDNPLPWVQAHRLLCRHAEEVVVETVELNLVEKAAVMHVGLSHHHGPVPVLLVVQVRVPTGARPLNDAVGAGRKHVPVVVVAPAATGHPHHQGLDQRLLALRLPRACQAQVLGIVLLLALDAAQLDAGQRAQEPRLQRHARRPRAVRVAHQVVAEDQHLVPGQGQLHLLPTAGPRVERDRGALAVEEEEHAEPPRLHPLEEALDPAGRDLVVGVRRGQGGRLGPAPARDAGKAVGAPHQLVAKVLRGLRCEEEAQAAHIPVADAERVLGFLVGIVILHLLELRDIVAAQVVDHRFLPHTVIIVHVVHR
mmetsp:Transcript_50989/g.158084  ORF Transcript_50989/g.158084 Transcript_50989/m.158084 type:complete len:343 (+) Transcript_50989:2911-3939(+)